MNWNCYYPMHLRNIGISETTPDLVELIDVYSTNIKAYCKSKKCAGGQVARGEPKAVRKNANVCPDCGDYLFYRKVDKKRSPKKNAQHS